MNETVKTIINFILVIATIVSVSFAVIKTNDAKKIDEVKTDIVKLNSSVNNSRKAITVLEQSFAVIENELKHFNETQNKILSTLEATSD